MNAYPSILYVEDDENSRKVMELIFGVIMRLGDVTYFENSENFLPRLLDIDPRPDLIFLDIHMKPYTGIDMLKMLRQLQEFDSVPVVALTASVMSDEIHELQRAGFNACLAKPVDMNTFPDTVHRILDGESIWRIAIR